MAQPQTRRHFLRTSGIAGAALGLSDLTALLPFSPASADEAQVTPDLVRFSSDIEPLVRLIEETPQDKCVAAVVERFRQGLPYRQFLAALYLASIRAAKWHGGMHGYDHTAYVVHSANQLALDLPGGEQLLPAFYALNCFKGMQKVYPSAKLLRTTELIGPLPAADHAEDELHAAMRAWEPDRAERAVVAMIRARGMTSVFEPLWQYAGRDWGFIGHLPILVSNSCRLLETIGAQHAEHVLRYVVAALTGWGKEHADHADVKPYWANLPRVEKAVGRLPGDWSGQQSNDGLTKELVTVLRNGNGDEACELAVQNLAEGKAQAGAVWDAVHLAAGEWVLSVSLRGSRPDGDALHANTAANALHYAFRASTRSDTRLLLTLQALAWMSMFGELSKNKDRLTRPTDITELHEGDPPDKSGSAIDAILATRTEKPFDASQLAFTLARHHGAEDLLHAARRLICVKSSGDPHDIKFPVAIFEDLDFVSPQWRPHLTAAATFAFWGSDLPDGLHMKSVPEAIRTL